MARSVPTSLAGVTHYGDLGVNFNQGSPVYVTCRGCASANFNRGCPSVVLMQALNANAPVFIVDVTRGRRGYLRAEFLPCPSIREEAQEEFSERREPVHHSSPVTSVSL
ncbi:hypothetical protein CDL15_Pgr021073 [Punica granatum]|uniref:Uncharacterized protein n=1 Tax=Punica granatum TaxID=22663 RepID=A0A218WR68_PUNGR|nr:hypothetical protein CDL15_Pgr021073 [Punica granatum]